MTSSIRLNWGDPLIYLHGRWDDTNTSWWAGTGFNIVATNLSSLRVHLGELTTPPEVVVSVSVNYGPWKTTKLKAGTNDLPLGSPATSSETPSVVRVVTEDWHNNNMQLEAVELNAGAVPRKYTPQPIKFQFIGDSLSAGQYNNQGVVDAWTFLTGEAFNAECDVQAQPGGSLTDMECWGNVHGLSYQFFQAEDTGYFYNTRHNYTKPWDFKRDVPPTHIVIHLGANDASVRYHIPPESFASTYKTFVERLRILYPTQPIFVLTPWGRFSEGEIEYYYRNPDPYAEVVQARHALGDKNVYIVDTTGWVTWADMFPENRHPNEEGHRNIARQFGQWLERWGLHPVTERAALAS